MVIKKKGLVQQNKLWTSLSQKTKRFSNYCTLQNDSTLPTPSLMSRTPDRLKGDTVGKEGMPKHTNTGMNSSLQFGRNAISC